jgi:translation initiation factor 2 alpha subunit (eIF-2alpha)
MQINTKPQPAKKIIDATMPANISAEDRKKLESEWAEKARLRNLAVEKETRIPTECSLVLKYQLRKYGKHWIAFAASDSEKGKMLPIQPAPSLLTSAIDALANKMSEEAIGR